MAITGNLTGTFTGVTDERQLDKGGAMLNFTLQVETGSNYGPDTYNLAAFRDVVQVVKGLVNGSTVSVDYSIRPKANATGRIFLNITATSARVVQGLTTLPDSDAGF